MNTRYGPTVVARKAAGASTTALSRMNLNSLCRRSLGVIVKDRPMWPHACVRKRRNWLVPSLEQR
jgi:hypothetical protein